MGAVVPRAAGLNFLINFSLGQDMALSLGVSARALLLENSSFWPEIYENLSKYSDFLKKKSFPKLGREDIQTLFTCRAKGRKNKVQGQKPWSHVYEQLMQN